MAPSTALPPALSMSMAHMVDRGTEVAAMPCCAYTGERPANCSPVGRVPPQLFMFGSGEGLVATQA